jgi:hypothetical protein
MLYRVTSLAYDPRSGTAFYTTDNTAFRDLQAVDVRTGKAHTLLNDARIGDIVFNAADKSIWGLRHLNGIVTIVRIPQPYAQWEQVYSFPYGQVLYDLDVSPDGRLLSASFGEANGNQSLRIFETEDLLDGRAEPIGSFDFGTAVPEGFVFAPDGRYLYGSSYYTGVSNIFRYEISTGDIRAVSNTDTGFFRPIPRDDGTLVVLRYTGNGFVPSLIDPKPINDLNAITFLGQQVAERHPVLRTWEAGSPARIPIEKMITREGPYEMLSGLALESVYPVVEGYKDSVGAGMHAKFSDPLGYDYLNLTATYTPDNDLSSDERLHLRASLHHQEWTAELAWNGADFYDIFGPTKRGQKGYAATLTYDKSLIFDRPRQLDLTAEVGYYGKLDRLPGYQNIETAVDRLGTARLELDYSNTRASLGHVDDEKGYRWSALAYLSHANGDFIPRFQGTFDTGFALPLAHSSLWLRTAAGFGIGERDDPFANFFFGGFGNNYVDNGEVKRYRDAASFPGFEIDEIAGRSFGKAMLEWNLPPLLFRRVGSPALHLRWARPALFATALVADPDAAQNRRSYNNAGGQVDMRISVLSDLEMTLSIGYAAGFEGSKNRRDEFMLSLKLR